MVGDIEPLERKVARAVKKGQIHAIGEYANRVDAAVEAGILTAAEGERVKDFDDLVMELLAVDDFDPSELGTKASATSGAQGESTPEYPTALSAAGLD